MATTSTIVEAKNICRTVAERRLLADVSLTLRVGQPLAIVGSTGSGKSLLVRSLVMLEPIDAGAILFRGKRVKASHVPRFRRDVVYLHQKPAIWEGTVEENLERPFDLAIHQDRDYDLDRAKRLLGQIGRPVSFLAQRADDLSGGESQIAALMRTLLLDPAVLLLDEPTAALDGDSTRAVERLVLEWFDERPESRSFIWISHSTEQVRRLKCQVVKMDQGRIVT
jgi:putative ABC transport system ATP-binding protein